MRPRGVLRLAPWLLVMAVAGQAGAGAFRLTAWDTESGLPQNSVGALVEDSQGFLWIATQQGLARFDGESFTIVDRVSRPALPDDNVRSLVEAEPGELWIGTYTRLYRKRGEALTEIPLPAPARGPVYALWKAPDGAVWAGTAGGAVRFGTASAQVLESDAAAVGSVVSAPGSETVAFASDGEAGVWIGSERGLSRWRAGRLEPGPAGLAQTGVRSLWRDADGSLIAGTDAGLFRLPAGASRAEPMHVWRLEDPRASALMRDSRGLLWIATPTGLSLLAPGENRVTLASGLSTRHIQCLLEDREGTVWIGTWDAGLRRLAAPRISTAYVPDPDFTAALFCLAEDREGRIFAGASDGTVFLLGDPKGDLRPLRKLDGWVTGIAEDRDGALWFATLSGLARYGKDRWTLWSGDAGPAGGAIRAITPSGRGGVWAGVRDGTIFRFDGEKAEQVSALGKGYTVASLLEDRDGVLWVGSAGGSLFRISPGGRPVPLDPEGRVARGPVSGISQDREGNVWVATHGGLERWRGDSRLSLGPETRGFQRLLDDGGGYLWSGSNRGILRIDKADVEAIAARSRTRLPVATWGTRDGLPSAECNVGQPGAIRTRGGELWFATMRGLATLDPARLAPRRAPVAYLEGVEAGGREETVSGDLELPPGRRDVRFHFTAPVLQGAERLRFRYRLAGYDEDWVEAGSRRDAEYTNLPPGRYRFEVAASTGGPWGDAAALSLRLPRPFWRSPLFAGLAVGAAAASIAGLVRAQVRRVRARERLSAELVRSRLHVLQVQLQPHFLFNALNAVTSLISRDPDRAERLIASLGDLLRRSLRRGEREETTLADELDFLLRYVEIQQARFDGRLQVRWAIAPEVRGALLPTMLLQPLVENAIKHGLAPRDSGGSVEIAATAEGEDLRVEVSDDGLGFRGTPTPGVGLSNTLERLRGLYGPRGGVEILPRESGGTTVRLTLPLKLAPADEEAIA
jgi:ligand-binding sensor domain-containing protein